MNRRNRYPRWLNGLITVTVLTICLAYSGAYIFRVPSAGFTLNYTGIVTDVDPCATYPGWCEDDAEDSQSLKADDQVIALGDVIYQDYVADHRHPWLDGYGPGDSLPITISRDGDIQVVHWRMPVVSIGHRARYLVDILFYLPFWLVGTAVMFFLQPRDVRWRLLVALCYLFAVWIATGWVSTYHVAGSALLVGAITWLLVPVCLHLHIVVPTPLFKHRRRFLDSLYAIAVVLAVLELLQLLPASAYSLGMFAFIAGSLGLLIFRASRKPLSAPAQSSTLLMLISIGLAFGPGLVLWVIPRILGASTPSYLVSTLSLLTLPIWPLLYAYAIYKKHLADIEFRAHRVVSLYGFIALYVTALITNFAMLAPQLELLTPWTIFNLIAIPLLLTVVALLVYPRWQVFMHKLTYGAAPIKNTDVHTVGKQISGSLEEDVLARLLPDSIETLASVSQSALCVIEGEDARAVYSRDASLDELPETVQQIQELVAGGGQFRPHLLETGSSTANAFAWVRLALPLVLDGETIGVWLLGHRAPEDYYPRDVVLALADLAEQAAVSIVNIRVHEQVQRKDDFLFMISHELVTPITNIMYEAQDLRNSHFDHPLNARQHIFVDGIEDRSNHLYNMVDRMLDTARMEYGTIRLRVWPIEVERVCRRALDSVQLQAQAKGISVSFDFDERADSIDADLTRVRQILINLLSNAIKFTPEGGQVGLEVAWDTAQQMIRFIVWDTGIGIAQDNVDQLFKLFGKLENSDGRKYKGTGLGLAIVKRLAEMHGGEVSVESDVGKGSRFIVSLPWEFAGDESINIGYSRPHKLQHPSAHPC